MQSKNRQKLLNAAQNTSPTLRRPYPTTVSHQQFRPQVRSHNTPYTAKHSIQTHHRDTQSTNSQKPLNTTQKQAAILYCDPTQLLFQINNAEQRSGQTTHHTATRSIQVRKRTTETRSERTARNLATPCKINRNTLLRPYPTTVFHQQFRTQVGSHNTPYTAKHSIQTRKRATEICSQRTARNFSTPRKTPALLCGDPTQLLFPINNSDHR